MDGVEKPSPRPVIFQICFGPSVGQVFNKPVSLDRPVRLGPRHCGQSAGPESAANAVPAASATIKLDIWRIRIPRVRWCVGGITAGYTIEHVTNACGPHGTRIAPHD